MRRLLPATLLLAAAAAPDPGVYTCRVSVTGTGPVNRPGALRECVGQVLVKLSANPDAATLAVDPPPVRDILYLDLMSDLPLHDEQGTRDRPFELVGHVDPEGAAVLLRAARLPAWTAPRPTLLVRATVTERGGRSFALTGDGPGERQRRALLDAADRFALPVALPTEGTTPAEQPALMGDLRWSEADFGWNATWRMGTGADTWADTWAVTGVSFDAAFRSGVGGAARRLAGSAPPMSGEPDTARH